MALPVSPLSHYSLPLASSLSPPISFYSPCSASISLFPFHLLSNCSLSLLPLPNSSTNSPLFSLSSSTLSLFSISSLLPLPYYLPLPLPSCKVVRQAGLPGGLVVIMVTVTVMVMGNITKRNRNDNSRSAVYLCSRMFLTCPKQAKKIMKSIPTQYSIMRQLPSI